MIRHAAIALLLLLPGTAWAAASCGISAQPMVFGRLSTIDPQDVTGQATIEVNCSEDGVMPIESSVSYNLLVDAGNSLSYLVRQMRSGGDTLNYNLYIDPAHSTIWGDGSPGTEKLSGTAPAPGTGVSTAYGLIPGNQPGLAAGSYSDLLTVEIEF